MVDYLERHTLDTPLDEGGLTGTMSPQSKGEDLPLGFEMSEVAAPG